MQYLKSIWLCQIQQRKDKMDLLWSYHIVLLPLSQVEGKTMDLQILIAEFLY